jgi:hypothetical protein
VDVIIASMNHLSFAAECTSKPLEVVENDFRCQVVDRNGSYISSIFTETVRVMGSTCKMHRIYCKASDTSQYNDIGWILKEDVQYCMICLHRFSWLFDTKEHCRGCGIVICSSCAHRDAVFISALDGCGLQTVGGCCYWGQHTIDHVPGTVDLGYQTLFARYQLAGHHGHEHGPRCLPPMHHAPPFIPGLTPNHPPNTGAATGAGRKPKTLTLLPPGGIKPAAGGTSRFPPEGEITLMEIIMATKHGTAKSIPHSPLIERKLQAYHLEEVKRDRESAVFTVLDPVDRLMYDRYYESSNNNDGDVGSGSASAAGAAMESGATGFLASDSRSVSGGSTERLSYNARTCPVAGNKMLFHAVVHL